MALDRSFVYLSFFSLSLSLSRAALISRSVAVKRSAPMIPRAGRCTYDGGRNPLLEIFAFACFFFGIVSTTTITTTIRRTPYKIGGRGTSLC